MNARKKRRIVILSLVLILSALSYYFNFYLHNNEVQNWEIKIAEMGKKSLVQLKPEEMEILIKEKIDSLKLSIASSSNYIPYYENSANVYDRLIQVINSVGKELDVNIDKIISENKEDYLREVFSVKGEGKFTNLYAFITQLENSSEITKVNLKEIKLLPSQDENGRPVEKIYFSFEVETFFTTNPEFKLDTLTRKTEYTKPKSISNYFKPIIKLDIPPNYDNLFEVDGAKLIALMPDGVYLVDRKGNSTTLTEGDPVYLGYLTKIDYENHSCEFLLNKGGIVERVILTLNEKERLR